MHHIHRGYHLLNLATASHHSGSNMVLGDFHAISVLLCGLPRGFHDVGGVDLVITNGRQPQDTLVILVIF